MALKIDSLELELKTSASSAATAVEKLATSLKSLKNVTTGGLGLGKIRNQLQKFSEAVGGINTTNAVQNIDNLKVSLGGLRDIINSINTENIKSLSVVVSKISSTSKSGIKQTAKKIGEIGEEAAKAANEVANLDGKLGGKGGSGKGKGKGKKGGLLKSAGGLFKSIGRVAFYRAIRSALKAVTTAIKEGTSNLYQFSKTFNGTFAQSLDAASTSVQYLKNGLAVGLAPIIEALTPALVSASDALADIGNRISEAYAYKNAKDTFTKATKSAKQYAEAVNAAKNAVLGFDELNVIDKGDDFSKMFKQADVDPQRAQETLTALNTAIGLTIGGVATGAIGKLFPQALGFTTGAGGNSEYNLGNIALKAAGMTLTIAGAVTVASSIKKAIEEGVLNDEEFKQLNIGVVESGTGLSLMTKSPIPLALSVAVTATASLAKLQTDLGYKELKEKYNYTDDDIRGAIKMGAWSKFEFESNGHWFLEGLFNGTWDYDSYIAKYVEEYWKEIGKIEKEKGNNALTSDPVKAPYAWAKQVNGIQNLINSHGVTGTFLQYDQNIVSDYAYDAYKKTNGLRNFFGGVDPLNLMSKNYTESKKYDFVPNDAYKYDIGSEISGTPFYKQVEPTTSYSSAGGQSEMDYYGPQAGSSEPFEIKVFLDGKQILDSIKKAQQTNGAIVGSGLTVD